MTQTETRLSMDTIRNMGFCSGGVRSFLDTAYHWGMPHLRSKPTVTEWLAWWNSLTVRHQQDLIGQYGGEMKMVASRLGCEIPNLKLPDMPTDFKFGKLVSTEYVSGRTARQLRFDSGAELYISYRTCVGAYIPGHGTFRTVQRYSVTTSKHMSRYSWRTPQTIPATGEQLKQLAAGRF